MIVEFSRVITLVFVHKEYIDIKTDSIITDDIKLDGLFTECPYHIFHKAE
jgi:hypothetical protein